MKTVHIKRILLVAAAASLVLFLFFVVLGRAVGKITILIVDESGVAVEKANVHMGFRIYTNGGAAGNPREVEGQTSEKGRISGCALASNFVAFSVRKDGYYVSFCTYKFKDRYLGHWVPWNPEITVVIRKIENQAPMYQRDTQMMHPVLEIPISGREVGFDLIESDWVRPYGAGKHPDMLFKLERQFNNLDDFEGTLTITFPNKYDGIQLVKYDRKTGSVFKLPRFAPEEGYQLKLVRFLSNRPGEPFKQSAEDDNNYIFRVRSEVRDGKFIKAMFGKIHGDIQFGMRGHRTASIIFKYFLNPDYTRNLEDGKNLLKLPEGETVNSN